jgi:hypothetical protein
VGGAGAHPSRYERAVAKAAIPRAAPVGFTGVTVGAGAAWATNYDRGELYRVAS